MRVYHRYQKLKRDACFVKSVRNLVNIFEETGCTCGKSQSKNSVIGFTNSSRLYIKFHLILMIPLWCCIFYKQQYKYEQGEKFSGHYVSNNVSWFKKKRKRKEKKEEKNLNLPRKHK